MKSLKLIILLLLFFAKTFAQVTFTIEEIPQNTPSDASLFLAGTINSWQPSSSDHQFLKDDDGRFYLTLKEVPDTFEYKICRGDWNLVEVDSTGRDISNRIYVDSLGSKVTIIVANWRDKIQPREKISTASKNVHFTPTSIEIPQLKRRRTVRVYFPENYASKQGFPVIYMFDGQNVFDASTSFAEEWRVDETLDSLFYSRRFECIVVAVYHGDSERLNEYTPWSNEMKEGGDGEKFARFIVKDLKPYIDKHYRTIPDRENTAIIGSSLGGLMSLYMALEYPDVFGMAGVFSPSLWWSEKSFEQIEKFKKRRFQKIYLLGGEKESEQMIPNLERAHELLKDVGFSDNELIMKTSPDGRHSETFWGREFPNAVKWFFNL